MPLISNAFICDLPVRFDNYVGCSHGCEYCFAQMRGDISQIKIGETAKSLNNWIKVNRLKKSTCTFFEPEIPLHWGGMSDPFQPIELIEKSSIKCLNVFIETQYPFVISTKSNLIAKEPYLSLIKQCNCAIQISAIGDIYNKYELGASTYNERIKAAEIISKYKRVILRHQPLVPQAERIIIENIKKVKDSGVYGVIIEFLKSKSNRKDTVKVLGDYCFRYEIIKPIFDNIKKQYNKDGIKVYAGENRLRQFGDGLCCCGVGDLFNTNKYNLNHILFDEEELCDNEYINIKNIYQGGDRIIISQASTRGNKLSKSLTWKEALKIAVTDKQKLSNYHIQKQEYQKAITKKIIL